MADIVENASAPPRRRGLPLILGAALALALGGGAFAVVYTGLMDGMLPTRDGRGADSAEATEFLDLPTVALSLGAPADGRVLRFSVTLEVAPAHKSEVTQLTPRLLDLLNSYLRAVEPEALSTPGALIRIRAQLLRRMQVVAGEGRIRDVLVTEFVMN
ncbi:MAG: flagellar basal body-associated FliL family protein [Alkalilacustris sp.]